MSFSGLPYTWNNKQCGVRNIKVRLDRSLGDDRFMELFDNSSVHHVQTIESDHCALLIKIHRSDWLQDYGGPRPFRYENMWSQHLHYAQVVERGWQPGSRTLSEVHEELGRMQQWINEESSSMSW
jgi:hypothetical protein